MDEPRSAWSASSVSGLCVAFPGAPPVAGGRVVFEWMTGEQFLIELEVPVPEAPDGLAIIGFDEGRGTFLQHYFDSRELHGSTR